MEISWLKINNSNSLFCKIIIHWIVLQLNTIARLNRATIATIHWIVLNKTYIIWINLATINQDKDNFVMPLMFGVHQLNHIPLFVLINQTLITIYYNDCHRQRLIFPWPSLYQKVVRPRERDWTSSKEKKILTNQPYLQTQGWVTTNKQFFKSSLMLSVEASYYSTELTETT